ncbi:hypothetical protein [Lewinella sp. W8]|uniref:hypothetical protein n=1 Tax=Lewinella sp. W8 TaxID=2528208 RepID=UPI0010686C1B|nr:hypothetical protein [Lewinella sp. W8]MTB53580.1 hypothetical protein [Lewinella sp. W8]
MSSQLKTLAVLLFLAVNCLSAQPIPLTDAHWQRIDNGTGDELPHQVAAHKGTHALKLEAHQIVLLKERAPKNFTLEMDVAGGAMPGIGFRAEDLFNYEFLYLRVFAGGSKEALQYAPVFNGALGWQLYNYPMYEVTADVSPEEWVHIKVEVFEDNLRVFVGDQVKPNLSIKLLGGYADAGQLFLKTSFANGYYSNIELTESTPFRVKSTIPDDGYLTDWMISPQTEGQIVRQVQYYNRLKNAEENDTWTAVKADRDGLVNLARYFDHPKEAVFAKTMIQAEEDKEVDLLYDFSQVMMIVLNDQIISYGYELDTENFGRISPGEHRITLPLKAGENKLVLWVRSDDLWQQANPLYLGRAQAMNWGFMAQLVDK